MLGLRSKLPVHACVLLLGVTPCFPQTIDRNFWMVDGQVYAVTKDADNVYIGGTFSHVGPYTGSAVSLDLATGALPPYLPVADGEIFAVIPDGSGGWYIGGEFTSIGGVARSRIAHVTAGFAVTAWDPSANGTVRALALRGSTVYAGGYFTTIGGQPRNYIAALDAATGAATGWNPNPNNVVYALTVHTHYVSCPEGLCPITVVYAGGDFGSIGGQARSYLAGLDPTTGAATSWNPNPNNRVITIHAVGSTLLRVYTGGYFTNIGGQPRNRIAALTAGGTATSWNPSANGVVQALAVSGATIYAGGSFTSIGGQARSYIAALDGAGAATSWNPGANSDVQALAVSGSLVYAGGAFTSIGGQSRNFVATLDVAGTATAWNPNADGIVRALAVAGSEICVVGAFESIGRLARNNTAALSLATGAATDWDPNASDEVRALAVSGSTVYAGGLFMSIGGQPREHIAALDASTGAATPWDPGADSDVRALAVSGSTVYAGGAFTVIGGQSRYCLAAFDAATGNVTPWDPAPNHWVYALETSGSTVYVGGLFDNVGGQNRRYLAAIDAVTGNATSWDPDPSAIVRAIEASGSSVYVGGSFSTIGGQSRSYLAELDAATGNATSWNPNPNSTVYTITVAGSKVYVGGAFTFIGPWLIRRFAEVSASTGLPSLQGVDGTPWGGMDGIVWALEAGGSTVFAGGEFQWSHGGGRCRGFAGVLIEPEALCGNTGPDPSWGACGTTVGTTPPFPPSSTLATDGAGGAYVLWGHSTSPALVNRVTADGSIAAGWPAGGVTVSADSAQREHALVADGSGGVFVTWYGLRNGVAATRCQRLTASGTTAPGWPAGGVDVPGLATDYSGSTGYNAASDNAGGLFIAGYDRLQHLDGSGAVVAGWPPGGLTFSEPFIGGVVSDASGGALVLLTWGASSVARVSPSATTLWQTTIPTLDPFDPHHGLVADGTGGGYVATQFSTIVLFRLKADGAFPVGWPAGGLVVSPATAVLADVKGDGSGGVLLCYKETSSPARMVLQRITSGGLSAGGWPSGGIQAGPVGQDQFIAGIAQDGDGGAFLTWQARTGSGPVSYWSTRICPNGSVAPGWSMEGSEVCPNIRYYSSGSRIPMVLDGAGGALASWFRRTAVAGWEGTMHVQRLGAEPPSLAVAAVAVGTPSIAVVGNATVTFDSVTTAGQLYFDLTTGPPPPAGLQTVPATAPAVYELATTAVFGGDIEVCLDYDPADVSGSESALRLYHYDGSSGAPAWVDITTSIDAVAHRICGSTTSLSPFAIVENDPTDALTPGAVLRLHQNRPNPFNPTTTITYEIPADSHVRLDVFDVRGRLVRTLTDGLQSAGQHRVVWSGDDRNGVAVASGVYFYRMQTPHQTLRRRMVLVR